MRLTQQWDDTRGQGSSEYALLLAGVVVLVITATMLFGGDIWSLFVSLGSYINNSVL